MLRETVRDFAAKEIAPRAAEIDRDEPVPAGPVAQARRARACSASRSRRNTAARRWATSPTSSRWRRSAAPRRRSASPTARTPTCASTRSAATAATAQKQQIPAEARSPASTSARWRCREPGAGSDVVGMKLRAERRGDRYVLNGNKMWITNGPDADVLVDLRQDRRARHHRLPRREGHEGLLAPRRSSTSSACAARTPASWCSAIAKCPAENVLGEEGKGVKVLMSGLDYERAVLAGGPLGIMAACLDVVMPYVHERKQFGQPIGEFQLMQGKLADMYTTFSACRAYVYAVGQALRPRRNHAQGRGRRDPLRRGEGDLDGGRGDPGAGRHGLHQRDARPGACGATPSSTRSAPAPPRSAAG